MIEIVFLGVNHNDPLGRDKICSILKNELKDFVPNAIAVEWKREIAYEVINQRKAMIEVLTQQYPNVELSDIKILANAMAFESDSHINIYPNLPVIWLDQERGVDIYDDTVANYFVYRKSYYDAIINSGISSIEEISIYVCSVMSSNIPSERDILFYNKLHKEIEENGYTKVICIVGASHADLSTEGSFANLFIKIGYRVISFDTTKITQHNGDPI